MLTGRRLLPCHRVHPAILQWDCRIPKQKKNMTFLDAMVRSSCCGQRAFSPSDTSRDSYTSVSAEPHAHYLFQGLCAGGFSSASHLLEIELTGGRDSVSFSAWQTSGWNCLFICVFTVSGEILSQAWLLWQNKCSGWQHPLSSEQVHKLSSPQHIYYSMMLLLSVRCPFLSLLTHWSYQQLWFLGHLLTFQNRKR